jgi:C-terminal processing protease CtpA/Prc
MSVLQCSGDEKEKTKHGTCIKVQQVFSNTPAARAGLQADDQIVKIGDAPVRRLCDMLDNTFTARVGQKLNLEIQRAAMLTNLLVEIAERPGSLPSLKSTPAAKNE